MRKGSGPPVGERHPLGIRPKAPIGFVACANSAHQRLFNASFVAVSRWFP
jgi:hypothetical protein